VREGMVHEGQTPDLSLLLLPFRHPGLESAVAVAALASLIPRSHPRHHR
jgi:hypothetical protein